jgi:hypothetical protein
MLPATILNLASATHGVDGAAKLDETSVAGALDDAPMMRVAGSTRSLRSPRRRANVRSSSEPARRLYPTTSAARIAASFHDLPPQSVAPRRVPAHRNTGKIPRPNTWFCDPVSRSSDGRGMSYRMLPFASLGLFQLFSSYRVESGQRRRCRVSRTNSRF